MEYAQKVILELLNTMSQEELGKVLDTPQSNISAFANGRRGVSKSAKKILSEKYGYDMDKLNEKPTIINSNVANNVKGNVSQSVGAENERLRLENAMLTQRVSDLESRIEQYKETVDILRGVINK